MKGLILKDLYAMGGLYRNTLFALAIVCVCLGLSIGAGGIAAATSVICATMIVTTFTLDEKCRWQVFSATLPVSRRDCVAAKYAVHLIYCLAGTAVGFIFALIINIFAKEKMALPDLSMSAVVGFILGMVFGFVVIPFMFKFGAEKARIIMMVIILLPTAAVFLLDGKAVSFVDRLALISPAILGAVTAAALVLAGVLSLAASIKIYGKKEF